LVNFALNPQAADDFVASGGNPAELVESLLEIPGVVASEARSVVAFGRGLLQDAKVLGLGGSEVAALRGAVSNVGGNLFQQDVQMALGRIAGNDIEYAAQASGGSGECGAGSACGSNLRRCRHQGCRQHHQHAANSRIRFCGQAEQSSLHAHHQPTD
jgi:hypothetical protein